MLSRELPDRLRSSTGVAKGIADDGTGAVLNALGSTDGNDIYAYTREFARQPHILRGVGFMAGIEESRLTLYPSCAVNDKKISSHLHNLLDVIPANAGIRLHWRKMM